MSAGRRTNSCEKKERKLKFRAFPEVLPSSNRLLSLFVLLWVFFLDLLLSPILSSVFLFYLFFYFSLYFITFLLLQKLKGFKNWRISMVNIIKQDKRQNVVNKKKNYNYLEGRKKRNWETRGKSRKGNEKEYKYTIHDVFSMLTLDRGWEGGRGRERRGRGDKEKELRNNNTNQAS